MAKSEAVASITATITIRRTPLGVILVLTFENGAEFSVPLAASDLADAITAGIKLENYVRES